jgi:hypothetical protein
MKSFHEILAVLKTSQCWNWHRGGHLSLYRDDIPNDRRECYTVEIPSGNQRTVTVNLRVLRKYDPVKNQWGEFIREEERNFQIEHRRGEKALRLHIQEIAQVLRGYPNPESLSYCDTLDGPKIAEARESAAYLARLAARNS